MDKHNLNSALEKLDQEFGTLNWTFYDVPAGSANEKCTAGQEI